MQEVLFRAYFSEGRNVSSDDVLKELVSEVGLNPNEALAALSDTKYIHEFEEAIKQTKLKGIGTMSVAAIEGMHFGFWEGRGGMKAQTSVQLARSVSWLERFGRQRTSLTGQN